MDNLRNKTLTNLLWRFAERCGAQGVSLVVSIILARILMPEAYGTIALITVFTQILSVFVDSGMGNALVQKKDADDLDFSSVFYFNIAMCSVIYICMFFAAPFIAKFYNDSSLTWLVRVVSLTILISGVKNIQHAYVSKTLQFKRFFFATLGGTIGAAVIGIYMAYNGYGVWALVAQQIFNVTVDTIILWITVKWRPKKMFSLKRLKGLFSFGSKLLASSLLETVYNNIRQLIIGKMYTSADLAYYNKGKQFPSLIITNINSSINSVLFPVMSGEQDNKTRVRNMVRTSIKTSTYIIAPFMIGLAAVATPLIRLLLTDKWISAVPFLRIFCITYMFMPMHTANLNAIKAMGRSDLFLKLEIIKKVIGIIVLLCTMWFGVMAMAYSMLFTSVCSQIINCAPNKKLLDYGYLEQLKDISPGLLLSAFMGICVFGFQFLRLPLILILLLQVLTGAFIYILCSYLFKVESFGYIISILQQILNKKHTCRGDK